MTHRVGKMEDVREDRRCARNKHTPVVEDEAIVDTPRVAVVTSGDDITARPQVVEGSNLLTQLIEELEG